MSSKAGSTFLTFLVSIPLAAMGLMAVFGVPPLASVIAASRGLSDTNRDFEEDDRGSRRPGQSQFEDWDSGTAPDWKTDGADPTDIEPGTAGEDDEYDALGFRKIPRSGDNSASRNFRQGNSRPERDEFGDSDPSDDAPSESHGLLSSRGGAKELPFVLPSKPGASRTSPPVSMKDSLKKLNSLGVKHYHLERGVDQDTWLFVCLFVPGDDPRITHRFEAESDDPDRAAAETVQQIDSWLLKRFRDQQPISQNAL
jgi:hypothetical protein